MAKITHGSSLDGRDMAEMLEEFCNGASRKDVEDFVSYVTSRAHRTLQQRIMSLFIGCIEKWSEDCTKNNFDERNKATVTLAKKFTDATGDKYDRGLPRI